jgi:hypothetical protein
MVLAAALCNAITGALWLAFAAAFLASPHLYGVGPLVVLYPILAGLRFYTAWMIANRKPWSYHRSLRGNVAGIALAGLLLAFTRDRHSALAMGFLWGILVTDTLGAIVTVLARRELPDVKA